MVNIWKQEDVQWRVALCTGGEELTLRMGDGPRELTAELGEAEKLTAEAVRRCAAKAVKTVRDLGGESALLDAAAAVEALGAQGLSALAQGAELALYRRETWKERKDKPFTLYVTGTGEADAPALLAEAAVLVRAICFARDLTNRPANKLTPVLMADAMAEAARKAGVEVQVLDEKETRALGMEAFHAVGDSSANPPRLIVLRYRGGAPEDAPIALVGKGVCFDSGGYCLKPGKGMPGMTGDMAGGVRRGAGPGGEPGAGECDGGDSGGGKPHLQRQLPPQLRHRLPLRQDHRGGQHRRRGPPHPGGRHYLRHPEGERL